MTRLLLFITVLYVLFALYGYQAIKTLTKHPWAPMVYLTLFSLAWVLLAFKVLQYRSAPTAHPSIGLSGGIFFSFLCLAMALSVILLLEDLVRVLLLGIKKATQESAALPSRRKFVSALALGLAAIPFGGLLYGMVKGKYNFKVLQYSMAFDDLPEAFHGYKITQISDVHSGSFDDPEKVAYAIDLINAQQGDVLLFTGDMVNNKATEMDPWKATFARLQAKDGKYSVLGNHDYGDYINWESPTAKQQNLQDLIALQKEIGFDLLLNESRYLEKNGAKIALVGVENWGKGGFKKAGDLDQASQHLHKNDFKILMSHDPSHWEAEVLPHPHHFHLTLSGHTHGMQFGIEIPGWFKWSPVQWRYKQWAGIYEQLGQYLNVNRGLGFLGYPGRAGIWPEITVITLKKKGLA